MRERTLAAIRHFVGNPRNDAAWRRILFAALAYAMERIAVWMCFCGVTLINDGLIKYHMLVEEIEPTSEKADLECLIGGR